MKKAINLKEKYPKGTRVMLTKELIDPYCPIPKGEKGTVNYVDDIGQIHVNWDNYCKLAISEDIDSFEIIS